MPKFSPHIRFITLGLLALFTPFALSAHGINYAMEQASGAEAFGFYLKLGFEHIIPAGLDHILFVAGLCLLSRDLKTILIQATAFTVAHSITLALSMKEVVELPTGIVEPIIALSIAFVALENILLQRIRPGRIAVIFLFGLIHGLGFASSLSEIGLPRDKFISSLISFNIGVELGQVAIICLIYFGLILPFRNKSWYRKGLVFPISGIIALVALFWTFQRL